MYFYWYNVSNLRNALVTEVRIIVNMPLKWHHVEEHVQFDAKWIIMCLESYVVWIPLTRTHQVDSM